MVFRVEERDAGGEEERWGVPASDDGAGDAKVAELERQSLVVSR